MTFRTGSIDRKWARSCGSRDHQVLASIVLLVPLDRERLLHDFRRHLVLDHCNAHTPASARTRWVAARPTPPSPSSTSVRQPALAAPACCRPQRPGDTGRAGGVSRLLLLLMRLTIPSSSALGSAALSTCSLSSTSAFLSAAQQNSAVRACRAPRAGGRGGMRDLERAHGAAGAC